MGVGKKKELAKQYTEHTDIARDEELGEGTTLGPKKVEEILIVDCEQSDDEVTLQPGRRVILIDMKKPRVEVYADSRHVGHATAVASALLRERVNLASRKGRSITGVIIEVSQFGNGFTVRVR